MRKFHVLGVLAITVVTVAGCSSNSGTGDTRKAVSPSPPTAAASPTVISRVVAYTEMWDMLDDPGRNSAYVPGVTKQICGYWNDPASFVASQSSPAMKKDAAQDPVYGIWNDASYLMYSVGAENGASSDVVHEMQDARFSAQKFRAMRADVTTFFDSVC